MGKGPASGCDQRRSAWWLLRVVRGFVFGRGQVVEPGVPAAGLRDGACAGCALERAESAHEASHSGKNGFPMVCQAELDSTRR